MRDMMGEGDNSSGPPARGGVPSFDMPDISGIPRQPFFAQSVSSHQLPLSK